MAASSRLEELQNLADLNLLLVASIELSICSARNATKSFEEVPNVVKCCLGVDAAHRNGHVLERDSHTTITAQLAQS